MLVAHLWELGGTWMDYWYLDENCSYHVLGALQAAAPRLRLIEPFAFRPLVVPADTVKVLFENPGLVRAVHYRPAIRTQFEARARDLDATAGRAVEALLLGPGGAAPARRARPPQAAVLDAALDLMDVRHAKELIFETDSPLARSRQALLPAAQRHPGPVGRAGHRAARAAPARARPRLAPLRPGRRPARAARRGPHRLRQPRLPALPPRPARSARRLPARGAGRVPRRPGSATTARARRRHFDESHFVRIVSLAPWTRFDKRSSWHVKLGAETVRDAGCRLLRRLRGSTAAPAWPGPAFGGALHAALFADAIDRGGPRPARDRRERLARRGRALGAAAAPGRLRARRCSSRAAGLAPRHAHPRDLDGGRGGPAPPRPRPLAGARVPAAPLASRRSAWRSTSSTRRSAARQLGGGSSPREHPQRPLDQRQELVLPGDHHHRRHEGDRAADRLDHRGQVGQAAGEEHGVDAPVEHRGQPADALGHLVASWPRRAAPPGRRPLGRGRSASRTSRVPRWP